MPPPPAVACDVLGLCAHAPSAARRYTGQYLKEEQLYRRLIKIFRTPPLLRFITRRKAD